MEFVEDIIFVVGLTGLVFLITDELLLIASTSHSRLNFCSKNQNKESIFYDIVGGQKTKVDVFKEGEYSKVGIDRNGDANNEVQECRSRNFNVDEQVNLTGGDALAVASQVADQNIKLSGVDRIADNLFDQMPQRAEVVEDQADVCEMDEECDLSNVDGELGKKDEVWLDDWEGIERSELEKQFGAAVAFVGTTIFSDCYLDIASNLKMDLYGFHKVAIEGPCVKPPPMALNVYARAKWNAWKHLEGMSREEAMEAYVTLLSRSIPDWSESSMNDAQIPANIILSVIEDHFVIGAEDANYIEGEKL